MRGSPPLQVTEASLVATARTLMGAPYLWGGTSAKGMDCSGFTKTIYLMNGLILPRDASQQVHVGTRWTSAATLPCCGLATCSTSDGRPRPTRPSA
jgi:cell wall-associated NlpC family hydrolase